MAKADFKNYGGKTDFPEFKTGAGKTFNEKSGGDVDPYGDSEKKEADAIDMNAGEAFNKKSYQAVDADGTDAPKKGNAGQRSDNNGDHFKVEDVAAAGNDCGKSQSFQTVKRK